jgi:hypothetical protein
MDKDLSTCTKSVNSFVPKPEQGTIFLPFHMDRRL